MAIVLRCPSTCVLSRLLVDSVAAYQKTTPWSCVTSVIRAPHRQKNGTSQRLILAENHGYVPTLSPPQVSSILCANEFAISKKNELESVRAFESNQLASNCPIEDRRAVAKLTQSGGSLFGVYDGHGGAACAQSVSERLLDYIAVSLLSVNDLEKYSDALKTDTPMEILHKYTLPNIYHSDEMLDMFRNSLRHYVHESLSFFDEVEEEMTEVTRISQALRSAFVRLDQDISMEALPKSGHINMDSLEVGLSGACGCVAYIRGSDLYVANLGDTRAVLGRQVEEGKWSAITLSDDHNADNEGEVSRLRAAHPPSESSSLIQNSRLLGYLIPLRAFGDVSFKWSVRELQTVANIVNARNILLKNYYTPPYLINEPEIRHHKLTKQDTFMILASDGLWDMLSNEEVVSLVGAHLQGQMTPNLFRLDNQPSKKLGALNSDLKRRKAGLAHKTMDSNAATHLVRHALGYEHRKVSEMLTFPVDISRYYRDDITVTVVYFDTENLPS